MRKANDYRPTMMEQEERARDIMSNGNLPSWAGANAVYGKAQTRLEEMAKVGHVSVSRIGRRTRCTPSADMENLIDAMNKGDEERLKAILMYRRLGDRG